MCNILTVTHMAIGRYNRLSYESSGLSTGKTEHVESIAPEAKCVKTAIFVLRIFYCRPAEAPPRMLRSDACKTGNDNVLLSFLYTQAQSVHTT